MKALDNTLLRNFAPTGTLRVALNHGNRVLVSRDKAGRAQGITVDLAGCLAQELGLPLVFVEMERAIDVARAAAGDAYDLCFLAIDPERAHTIDFSPPYIRIEGSYLVNASCAAADAQVLVAEGYKVGTVEGSAYTLDLARKPGAENLVYYPDIDSALQALDQGQVAALAGIKNVMQTEASLRQGARVVEPPFMEILQAMGMPAGRVHAFEYLQAFVAQMARSGRTGEILERHGVAAACAVSAV